MTLISDNQNSVSPKALTEKILIKNNRVKKIKLHVSGFKTLNISQYCNTLEATMISTLVTSDHIPQYNQPIVKPSDESTNLVEYELKEPETG